MNFPLSISVGDFTIPLHAVFEFAAFFIGFRYFIFLRKKQTDSISTSNRIWILIGAIIGSTIGSRLVGGLEDPQQIKIADSIWMHFYQNKTVLGGFLGGVWGVEGVKYFLKEKKSSGDLFTYPMLLALIIGRIGCFSMGVYEETYGVPTTFFTGMQLGDGVNRHPVTLYEMGFLMLLWVALVAIEKRQSSPSGNRFKRMMIAYLIFRFLLDFIKPHYTFSIGLSTIQITCIIGLMYYSFLSFYKKFTLQHNTEQHA